MCEVIDNDKVARKDGIIALQIHAGPPMKVQFRNVRFKELKHDNPMKADAKKKIVFIAGLPATAMLSTNTMPAACCWPSASRRASPRRRRSSTRAGRKMPRPWTTRPAWSSSPMAATATR